MSNVYGGGFAALKGYEAGEDGGKERKTRCGPQRVGDVGYFVVGDETRNGFNESN